MKTTDNNLQLSSALREDEIRIVALGGLGEIGLNCLALEQGAGDTRERLLVDCGAMFRDGEWGVDAYGPRLDWLLSAPDALRGVVLTHGHEDHIGALWTLARALGPLRQTPIPVHGPPYAVELCRVRAEEYPVMNQHLAFTVAPIGSRLQLGGFGVESVRMTHSTPDASALAIQCAAGTLVHSGDFKLDDSPPDGLLSDTERLLRLGDAGVRMLLADSTNALAEGRTRSEALPAAALKRHLRAAPARVVVGLFASNVQRVDAAAQAAIACGRSVCLLGRSLRNHVAVSQRLGRLHWPSDLLVPPDTARHLAPEKLCYLVTGTQGESRAALSRIASRQHRDLQLDPGDTVLLSSRIIPGQERGVVGLINELEAQGVTVIGRSEDADIHVSGHARRAELSELMELLRPDVMVPLHGTPAHLHAHAALARQLGIESVRELRNGKALRLSAAEVHEDNSVNAGVVGYRAGREVDPTALRQRRKLGYGGVLMVALLQPRRVELRAVGLALDEEALLQLREDAEAAWEEAPEGQNAAERVRRLMRRKLAQLLGYKPAVEVLG